jgi:BirA family biotin operon repressor/biotin-[acetyl-CoA-carboxylase] ligase
VILHERTRARLAATTRFSDIRLLDEIDSTNRYLLDLATGSSAARSGGSDEEGPVGEGLVAVAEHQTAGRGRMGRSWMAPPGGSLLTSILLRASAVPLERRQLVTVAVALAAAAACEEVAGFRPALKWPNDLVVDDAKLAGILAEAFDGGVVVGLGLNVNWSPDALPDGATSANLVAGRDVDREALFVALLEHLEGRCQQLDAGPGSGTGEGQAALAADYRAASATLGRPVRAELPGRAAVTGTAESVDDAGHLWIRQPAADGGGLVEVTAGDVVHLRPV